MATSGTNSSDGIPSSSSSSSSSSASNSNSNRSGESSSSSSSSSGPSRPSGPAPGFQDMENGSFECNICLDTAKDAVVSLCGHLFCWPCLHQWLETKPNRQVCPVCKAAISREKVIPLYGRGSCRQDPRDKLPPRPAGQRSEPTDAGQGGGGGHFNSANFPGFGFGDGGFHMSFGIGAFPFGFFASSFNFNDPRTIPNPTMNADPPEDLIISRLFLWVAIALIVWLLLA